MIFDKEIIEDFNDLALAISEHEGREISDEAVATLVAAKMQYEILEYAANHIATSVDNLELVVRMKKPGFELTFDQANAIIDMDDHGYSEGLGPRTGKSLRAWDGLLTQAETITGRKADGSE